MPKKTNQKQPALIFYISLYNNILQKNNILPSKKNAEIVADDWKSQYILEKVLCQKLPFLLDLPPNDSF